MQAPGDCLTSLRAGQSGRVARVADEDPALLRYLTQLGITPNVTVTVTEKAPFNGPVHLRVGRTTRGPIHPVGMHVASQVYVETDD